jgi:hypothetical protein
MAKYTYIIQYISEDGHDSVFAYSSQKACYEFNAEEIGWSIDKVKRHDFTKAPLVSSGGTVVMHRSDPVFSMGDHRKMEQAAWDAYEEDEKLQVEKEMRQSLKN